MKNHEQIITLVVDSFTSLHDPNDDGHGERTAKLAVALAKRVDEQKDKKFLDLLYFAMRVHDCGKIPISETILNKPTPLTIAERNMIKSHSLMGVQALKSLKLDELIYIVVELHHENFDGSGYPHGLKGNEIHFAARTARIVDCYDAMTNLRPYRNIFSTKLALVEMEKEVGTSFDPKIFDKFHEMILMERIV